MYSLWVTKFIHMVPISSAYYEKVQNIKLYLRKFYVLPWVFSVLNNKL